MSDNLKVYWNWAPHMFIYLCGPIDFALDGGIDWRKEITELLVSKSGVPKTNILDPTNKPLPSWHPMAKMSEGSIISEARQRKDWPAMTILMKRIAHLDLRMVDLSSLVIAGFPKYGSAITQEFLPELNSLLVKLPQNCKEEANELFSSLTNRLENMQQHTYGSIHEIVVARQQHKPVFLIWEGGIETVSSWLCWLVGEQYIFPTIEACVDYLTKILTGQVAFDLDDWMFLDPKPNKGLDVN